MRKSVSAKAEIEGGGSGPAMTQVVWGNQTGCNSLKMTRFRAISGTEINYMRKKSVLFDFSLKLLIFS